MSDINELMKRAVALKKKLDKAEAAARTVSKEYEEVRTALLGAMNVEHLDSARIGKSIATVSPVEVVEVEDWDAFYSWMVRAKAYDALQRRPAVGALRDRRESARGGKIPGVKFSKVRRLTLKVG